MFSNYIFKPITFLILIALICSCKKFVEVAPPQTQLVDASVFSNDVSALAAMTGIYSRMISSNGFADGGSLSITFLCGLSSDELKNYSNNTSVAQFFTNSLLPTNPIIASNFWNEPFQYIYSANAILEGLNNPNGVSAAMKEQLNGEAKFVRAFCYFYLVNIFGDVPIIMTTDYRANTVAPRSAKDEVYSQIISDLKDAQSFLPGDFSKSNYERVRPTKSAATALLARVYLFNNNWANAEAESSLIIENTELFELVDDLNNVFLKNSKEAIWQLMPNQPGFNTNEGRYFILTSTPSIAALTSQFVTTFDSGDNRKSKWISNYASATDTYYYPWKYKLSSGADLEEYSMVLRLAEQYLIRAEARAQQNKIPESKADLNAIRQRAGLPDTDANDKASLLDRIMHERQVELFAEWGHRWFDLKRTNKSAVLGPIKNIAWNSNDELYPVPQSEVLTNPSMRQNPGY